MFEWFYAQDGVCRNCGTRLDLQADHVNPRIKLKEEADTLDNIQLLCRRCNVVRRESHKQGGLTFLTTQSALMWILFVKQPKTYKEYHDLCREYGLTMANIRFQEGWAMAEWLHKQGIYNIEDERNAH
ncbi:HNH endonuclease [Pontibacter amylolyticus]